MSSNLNILRTRIRDKKQTIIVLILRCYINIFKRPFSHDLYIASGGNTNYPLNINPFFPLSLSLSISSLSNHILLAMPVSQALA